MPAGITTVQLRGTGIARTASLPRPSREAAGPVCQGLTGSSSGEEAARKAKPGGVLSLDAEVQFPLTAVGKIEVAKVDT